MALSPLTFNRQFSRFEEKIRLNSGGSEFKSFREGLPSEWEDYKEDVRREALARLDFRKWKTKDIGKGGIIERAIHAIEINDPRRHLRNNLVAWQNRYGHKSRSHRALLDAKSNRSARHDLERWFFDFFRGPLGDEAAFEGFRKLVGNRYDIIAYLFFLKDWKRFMPIAPTTFDKALKIFEIDLVTSGHCSWDNYTAYNESLKAVQESLRDDAGVRDVRLIDAHSFCWMLIRLKLPAPSSPPVISVPKPIKELSAIASHPLTIVEKTEFDEVDEEKFIKMEAERRRLGRLAEDIALRSERLRLREAGHSNPEGAATSVSNQPGRGYDILSCEINGTPRHIEVKAARTSGRRFSFFLTPYEWERSRRIPNYHFYLVVNARSVKPVVRVVGAGQVLKKHLAPASFLTSFAERGA